MTEHTTPTHPSVAPEPDTDTSTSIGTQHPACDDAALQRLRFMLVQAKAHLALLQDQGASQSLWCLSYDAMSLHKVLLRSFPFSEEEEPFTLQAGQVALRWFAPGGEVAHCSMHPIPGLPDDDAELGVSRDGTILHYSNNKQNLHSLMNVAQVGAAWLCQNPYHAYLLALVFPGLPERVLDGSIDQEELSQYAHTQRMPLLQEEEFDARTRQDALAGRTVMLRAQKDASHGQTRLILGPDGTLSPYDGELTPFFSGPQRLVVCQVLGSHLLGFAIFFSHAAFDLRSVRKQLADKDASFPFRVLHHSPAHGWFLEERILIPGHSESTEPSRSLPIEEATLLQEQWLNPDQLRILKLLYTDESLLQEVDSSLGFESPVPHQERPTPSGLAMPGVALTDLDTTQKDATPLRQEAEHSDSTGVRKARFSPIPLDPDRLRLVVESPKALLSGWFARGTKVLTTFGPRALCEFPALGLRLRFSYAQGQHKVFPRVYLERSHNVRGVTFAHHQIEVFANRNPAYAQGYEHAYSLQRGHQLMLDLSADQAKGTAHITIREEDSDVALATIALSWFLSEKADATAWSVERLRQGWRHLWSNT